MKVTNASAWIAVVLAIPALAFLIRVDSHTDDTGIIAGLIIATAFLLSVIHPHHAWAWAVLLGAGIPLAEVLHSVYRTPPPASRSLLSGLSLVLFITAIGMIGAYGGVFVRRLIGR